MSETREQAMDRLEAKQIEADKFWGLDLSDYQLTSGAWSDGLAAGVSATDMTVAFLMASEPLEFERNVWLEIEKLGDKAINPPNHREIMTAVYECHDMPEPEQTQYLASRNWVTGIPPRLKH